MSFVVRDPRNLVVCAVEEMEIAVARMRRAGPGSIVERDGRELARAEPFVIVDESNPRAGARSLFAAAWGLS